MTVQEFREAYAKIPSNGWLDLDEALLLIDAAERTTGPMVEIGSYYGRSSVLLAHLYDVVPRGVGMDPTVEPRILHCVDPWADCGDFKYGPGVTGDEVLEAFKMNVKPFSNVVGCRTRVEDWSWIRAEFVYCDGDHSYSGTVAQIRKAQECRAKAIAVHDVNDSGGGVHIKRACLELLGPWNERVNRLAVWRF
jgi:hypothetical protein